MDRSPSKSAQDVFWCPSVQEELNDGLLSSSVGAMEGSHATDIGDGRAIPGIRT